MSAPHGSMTTADSGKTIEEMRAKWKAARNYRERKAMTLVIAGGIVLAYVVIGVIGCIIVALLE